MTEICWGYLSKKFYFNILSSLVQNGCIDHVSTRQHTPHTTQHGQKVAQKRIGRYKQRMRIAQEHTCNNAITNFK
jgi:hypothetical protein